eukprot:CAMPEP_0201740714 /NCGR_PEP_ID=MMETSP0593-20130828/46445_1 /ASSEMBLY_ACC=CAM_ASM_000672 /TAXON_ID=267983 /ORGANISM="Skeletonema japonicum, Strain CCMP2506" /LENGTH=304 /DNA_ID=CAMNT_0048235035 /DNA_START=17 /DNA_END=931 /DNA_ORIENTATION=-
MTISILPASIGAATTATIVVAISIISVRILNIVRCIHNNRRKRRRSKERGNLQQTDDETLHSSSSPSKIKTVVFLGSGGHTTEMIQLLQELDPKIYAPIVYIVAKSDVTSIPRLQRYILSNGTKDGKDCYQQWEGRYPQSVNNAIKSSSDDDDGATTTPQAQQAQVYTLPRAREVHQSYISSIFTTLYSTYKTAQLLWRIQPHLIVTNGPGTCVPIVYCAFILRCLFSFLHLFRFDRDSPSSSSSKIIFRTIFIESLCRVKTLSLSGKLVYPIVDSFVVHWPSLMERFDMVEICDVLVPSLDLS